MKKNGMHLYQHIQDCIVDLINRKELHAGDRVPAEQDLAIEKKVSRLTVRKAYANLIKAGILLAVQGKGTFVSDLSETALQALSPGMKRDLQSKKTIGIIFPEITIFFAPILKGIEEIASRNNYTLSIMFNDTFERESNAISTMQANGVDGIIINPQRAGLPFDKSQYKQLQESGVPCIMVGKPPVDIGLDCVMFNSDAGAYDGVTYLIGKGHRRILHLFHSEHDAEALFERRKGYTEAISTLATQSDEYELDCANPAWLNALEQMTNGPDAVTAVFSDTDSLAVQAYLHLSRQDTAQLELEDYVTFNDTDVCRKFGLNMSLIEIPKVDMGRCAVEMLKEKIEGKMHDGEHAVYSIFHPRIM